MKRRAFVGAPAAATAAAEAAALEAELCKSTPIVRATGVKAES
jgi:hypothetical protein